MDQTDISKAPEGVAADGSPVDPMARMSEVLTTQALALDAMFTELVDYAAKRFEASSRPVPRAHDGRTEATEFLVAWAQIMRSRLKEACRGDVGFVERLERLLEWRLPAEAWSKPKVEN